MKEPQLFWQAITTGWGDWTLIWHKPGIVQFGFGKLEVKPNWENKELKGFSEQLTRYLAGKTPAWDWPLDLQSGTPFQKQVWQAIGNIPYGSTKSYADLAKECGSPKAYRAVGGACGANPVMLIVPCHRVVGKDGKLTGFSAGLPLKTRLLELERNGL